MLLYQHDLFRAKMIQLVFVCGIGHLIGGIAYYLFAVHSGADSVFYFENATRKFSGTGYHFAFYVVGQLRYYFVNDSFLGAFLFSSALAFLGSIFYLLAYKALLDKLSNQCKYYLLDSKMLSFPGLILLCWPSYFFWSAALVKDNFAFICVGIFFYCIASNKFSLSKLLLVITSSLLGFMIRPYLFIIVGLSIAIYMLIGSKMKIYTKIIIIAMIAYAGLLLLPQLVNYVDKLQSLGSLNYVANYAIRQQQYMSIGSSIPVPTHNPQLLFLFLPYLILVNLLLPLFYGASNLMGLISSFENFYLLGMIILLIRNRHCFRKVRSSIPVVNYLMIYFIVGMSFLSMMNTNLGLAMREKMMYVPALLIVIMLVYAYRRILILQGILREVPEHERRKIEIILATT